MPTERQSHSKVYGGNATWHNIGRKSKAPNSTCNIGTILSTINWTTKKSTFARCSILLLSTRPSVTFKSTLAWCFERMRYSRVVALGIHIHDIIKERL